jgi:hypothetical protein
VKMRGHGLRIALLVLGWTALYAAALIAGSSQNTNEGTGSTAQTYKGLSITAKSLERAKNVSLRDCPPGANTVRGVIRPTEDNEFVTVEIDVNVLASFQPVALPKPVLYDASGEAYKTAQSFGEMNAQPSYSCKFSFRMPKGSKVSRLAIGDASFDLTSLDK